MRLILFLLVFQFHTASAQSIGGAIAASAAAAGGSALLASVSAKEYNKEASLYRAKEFLMNEIIGTAADPIKFDVDPLVASNSGELTTLVYKCESNSKIGLLLGFNGLRQNLQGVIYQERSFRDLPLKDAKEFCEKIEVALKVNSDYLQKDENNNNIYFAFRDVNMLMYASGTGYKLRVFWNGYDAEWDYSSFTRTVKRLKKEVSRM